MATLVKKWGEAEGMAFFRKLSEMRPDVRKGHPLLAQLVSAGEIAVCLTAYSANVETLKRKGAPIDYAPIDAIVCLLLDGHPAFARDYLSASSFFQGAVTKPCSP